jgi:nucleotide-binding universal stress UspA family protein
VYDRFLVPLDGSPLAEKAAAPAAELAKQCDAELIFLRVSQTPSGLPEAVDYLERVGEEAEEAHFRVRCEAYVGDPAERIVQAALEESVDLIVMCSHGRTGLARTIFGSVAETVMRGASCPVMVVKALTPETGGSIQEMEIA